VKGGALMAEVILWNKTQTADSGIETQVHILGPLRLQNELLASHLEKETGLKCAYRPSLGRSLLFHTRDDHPPLILRDCQGSDMKSVWAELGMWTNSRFLGYLVALFNVRHNIEIEIEAAKRGVRGVFYKDAPLEILVRGTRAILDGKVWFSRDTMAKLLMEARNTTWISKEIDASIFTPREKEILLLIASGATSPQIAEKLCISPHTVRTHTCNIYQKIHVTNRLEAALWATKNL
jgi:DNA-binding NarL/FixJ family response regulator